MAKAVKSSSSNIKLHLTKPKKSRPGVHSKKKNSKLIASKSYRKRYSGQGR